MIKTNYVQGEYRSRIMSLVNPKRIEQKYKNKRGSSYDEVKESRIELNESEPISSIITQIKKQPQLPSSNERCFSYSPKGTQVEKLLPPQTNQFINKKTLVLDLDETLVHSGFKPFNPSDIILEIEFEGVIHEIHVLVRPGVDQFLKRMSQIYEIVIFTASLSKYANPLLNILDPNGYCIHRLFREHCTMINNVFVKDLKKLNRDIKDIIIVDNSPISYVFNQDNGFPVESWYMDRNDNELNKILPILEYLSNVSDVRKYIPQMIENQKTDYIKAESVINHYNQVTQNQNQKEAENRSKQHSELNRIDKSANNDGKGININIVTNNYTNLFISNNSINTKETPNGKDTKKMKSLNLFRNSNNNTTTNDNDIISHEPKTSKNTGNINIKSLEKGNNILSQSITSNIHKSSKYSSLLDKKIQTHITKSNQNAKSVNNSLTSLNQTNNEIKYSKSKKQLTKSHLNKTPPLQVMIMPSSTTNSFSSNISLIRPNSNHNLNSNSMSSMNKKKNLNEMQSNSQFPRPKSSTNIISSFFSKTPKIPLKKKGITTPLDDIFIKRRLSSTSRHKKLKASLNFQSGSGITKKNIQLIS